MPYDQVSPMDVMTFALDISQGVIFVILLYFLLKLSLNCSVICESESDYANSASRFTGDVPFFLCSDVCTFRLLHDTVCQATSSWHSEGFQEEVHAAN